VFLRVNPNKKPNIWKLLFFSYGVLKTNIWFSKNRTFEMSENRTLEQMKNRTNEQMKNRTFEISRTNQLLGTTWHNVWRLGNPTLSAALTAALVTIMGKSSPRGGMNYAVTSFGAGRCAHRCSGYYHGGRTGFGGWRWCGHCVARGMGLKRFLTVVRIKLGGLKRCRMERIDAKKPAYSGLGY